MSITFVDALLGQKRMRVHSVKKLFIRIHSCRCTFVTEEQEMPFSRSSVLFWTEALRSNDEAMTRRKRQKEQREIFCKLESRVTGYSRFANVNRDDDSFHYAARNIFRLLLDP